MPCAAGAPRTQFTPRDEAPENFPAGAGRDETFYACTACHNFKLVAAQGMTRRQWDESIALMMTKHGMHALDDKDTNGRAGLSGSHVSAARTFRRLANPFLKP